MITKVYLVRHGENKANLTHEFSCRRVDYSLTPRGRLQARQTARYCKNLNLHAVYSSPLKRAFETASLIGAEAGLLVQVKEHFRELDVGRLEEEPPSQQNWQLHNDIIRSWMAGKKEVRFPSGENYNEAAHRMLEGLKQVLADSRGLPCLIVGHGGIFFTGISGLCPDVDIRALSGSPIHNCSVTEIDILSNGDSLNGSLVRWASIEHLKGEAAELVTGLPEEI